MHNLLERIKRLPAQAVALPKNVKLFLFSVLVYGMAIEGISAVLLNLYLLRLGYGTEFIGTLNSAGLFVFALVSLPIGAVQRFSSRRMLQMGLVFSLIGLLGLSLAEILSSGPEMQAVLLISFRIMAMIGLSCYFVHQIPFSMQITKPEWHSRIMALTMATFSLAAFVGSWFGGLLPEWFSTWLDIPLSDPRPFQVTMLVATAVVVPGLIANFMITEPVPEPVHPQGEDLSDTNMEETEAESTNQFGNWRAIIGLVLLIIFIRALQTSGVGVMLTFSNVYFDDFLNVPTSTIGFVSGLGRLLGVPLSLTIPWLVGRYGNFKLVLISLGLIAALMLPIALIPSWPIAAVALIAINSMGSLRYLSFISFTMSLVTEKQRSLISGAGEMAIGAGFAASSFIGGYLISWYGYRELFLFGATITTIGTLIFWIIFRKRANTSLAMPVAAD